TSGKGLWRRRLAGMVSHPDQAQVAEFITTTVRKAMTRVQRELDKQGWSARLHEEEAPFRIWLEVIKDDRVDFVYEIRMIEHALPDYAFPEMDHHRDAPHTYYRAEVFLRRGGQAYDLFGFDQQDIITDILDQLEKHLHFLHISPASLPWNMAEHDEMLQASPGPAQGR
ncbi:MAG: choline transporter, partial [Haliea sp.]